MELGALSVSLAVRDIGVSRLFQGLFDKNILTFNPGWDSDAAALPAFTDVRELQRQLRRQGIQPATAADEAGSGPASFTVVDPDGNQILIDQHR